MRVLIRTVPLLTVPLLAMVLMSGDLLEAAWVTLVAMLKTVVWGAWICGPLSLAVCLAIISRDAVPRIVAEVMLVLLTVVNLVCMLGAVVLPFVDLQTVFFYLPFGEFLALSLVVATVLVGMWGKGKIAKKLGPATLNP